MKRRTRLPSCAAEARPHPLGHKQPGSALDATPRPHNRVARFNLAARETQHEIAAHWAQVEALAAALLEREALNALDSSRHRCSAAWALVRSGGAPVYG